MPKNPKNEGGDSQTAAAACAERAALAGHGEAQAAAPSVQRLRCSPASAVLFSGAPQAPPRPARKRARSRLLPLAPIPGPTLWLLN